MSYQTGYLDFFAAAFFLAGAFLATAFFLAGAFFDAAFFLAGAFFAAAMLVSTFVVVSTFATYQCLFLMTSHWCKKKLRSLTVF